MDGILHRRHAPADFIFGAGLAAQVPTHCTVVDGRQLVPSRPGPGQFDLQGYCCMLEQPMRNSHFPPSRRHEMVKRKSVKYT